MNITNFRLISINVISTTPDNIFPTWIANIFISQQCKGSPVTSYDFPTKCTISTAHPHAWLSPSAGNYYRILGKMRLAAEVIRSS
jgi:hypothetical protein